MNKYVICINDTTSVVVTAEIAEISEENALYFFDNKKNIVAFFKPFDYKFFYKEAIYESI